LAAAVDAAEPEGDGEALPEFLAGDDEETPADEADESRMIAAE
jgi:ParB family chromosome partitioning protein